MRPLCLLLAAGCLFGAATVFAQGMGGPGVDDPTTPWGWRYRAGPNNACNPVSDFRADPTGVRDATAAINSCAAVTKNGQRVNVYLPAGTYRANGQLNISSQCLYGDSRSNTTITVDQAFSSSASGIIATSGGGEQQAPCIHDLDIEFAQPGDQTLRSNFLTLADGCTSGPGGTGCKYPPALYIPGGRVKLWNLRIARAWDGISSTGAGGVDYRHLELSAFHVGLAMSNGFDFGRVDGVEFWDFGFSVDTPIYGVFNDGNTIGLQIDRVDGTQFSNIRSFVGRVQLTAGHTFSQWSNLSLDTGATLEITASNTTGVQIATLNQTGTPNGTTNTNCPVTIGSGAQFVTITNINAQIAGSGNPGTGICSSGLDVVVNGGRIVSNSPTARAVSVNSGSFMSLTGMSFPANTGGGAYTVPLVDVKSGGAITFVGNQFPNAAGTNVGGIAIAADASKNQVSGNNFNGWSFSPPGALGYYEASGGFSPTVQFGGLSTGVTYAGQAGSWTQRGKNMHVEWQLSLSNKGSATGQAAVANFPLPAAGSYGGNCSLNFQANMTGVPGTIVPVTVPSGAGAKLQYQTATGSSGITDAYFTNTSQLIGGCDYLTAP